MKRNTVRALWAAAVLLLAVVIVFANLPDRTPAPDGTAPGERLPDFSIRCLDGSEFSLSEQRGKVVVINIWATWCAPCVNELPQFDRLQREHPEDVAVLALHALPVTSNVSEYLSAYDYGILFAVDEDGIVSSLIDVSTVIPQTVVVDPDGIVTYNRESALTYEKLTELVASAQMKQHKTGPAFMQALFCRIRGQVYFWMPHMSRPFFVVFSIPQNRNLPLWRTVTMSPSLSWPEPESHSTELTKTSF